MQQNVSNDKTWIQFEKISKFNLNLFTFVSPNLKLQNQYQIRLDQIITGWIRLDQMT